MAMTPEDVLALFEGSGEAELTTPEVADALDISKPAAWRLLADLAEEGALEKRPGEGLEWDAWTPTGAAERAVDGSQ